MKRTVLAATLMITALSGCILGQTPSKKSDKDEKAKKEVIALANAYHDAYAKRDAAAMERILADEFADIPAGGGLPITKFLMLRMCKELPSDAPRIESIKLDENFTFVRVYGETAVLFTKITLKWRGTDEELNRKWKLWPENDAYLMTFVAVKKNGTWQIVSTHESEYQKPQVTQPKN